MHFSPGEIEDEPEDKSVPLFMLPNANDGKKEREEAQADEPLRLTLCRKGQRKMVMLQPRTMNQLLLLVQQKFRFVYDITPDPPPSRAPPDH